MNEPSASSPSAFCGSGLTSSRSDHQEVPWCVLQCWPGAAGSLVVVAVEFLFFLWFYALTGANNSGDPPTRGFNLSLDSGRDAGSDFIREKGLLGCQGPAVEMSGRQGRQSCSLPELPEGI